MFVVNPPLLYSYGILLLFLFPRDLSSFLRQSFTQRSVADMLPATFIP
ncbi:peptidylprolyl isomerase [Escherichia coli]|nr:peptidylprolyl isomerase [Escherichia coli]